jgi:hypothetical protein
MEFSKNQRSKISIDSTVGGNGDVWMRLVSLYAISALKPEIHFYIKTPSFIIKLAQFTFGDRLNIISDSNYNCEYHFTSLGIKDLFKEIVKGKKFISPYARSIIHDKKKKELKDLINHVLYYFMDMLGYIQVPDQKWIEVYQGYLDIIGLKKLRSVSYDSFLQQLEFDYPILLSKLESDIPISPELKLPADIKENTVVFPTGTSRQFIPVWWAKENLPNAYYAFFYNDKDANVFIENGLKVVSFYKEPGDIIALSKAARKTLTTDSFPSHLLQYATNNCIVTITEVLKSRIISPAFKGQVVDNQVACHPCLHIVKSLDCAAGYKECLNWKNTKYTQDIINRLI